MDEGRPASDLPSYWGGEIFSIHDYLKYGINGAMQFKLLMAPLFIHEASCNLYLIYRIGEKIKSA